MIVFIEFRIEAAVGIINPMNQNVKIRDSLSSSWIVCDTIGEVNINSIIITNKTGAADLVFADNTVIFIDTSALLKISNLDKKTTSIILKKGLILLDKISDSQQEYIVATPTAKACIRGTTLLIRANNSFTEIAVFEGSVNAGRINDFNDNSNIKLLSNKQVVIANDSEPFQITELSEKIKEFYETNSEKILDRFDYNRNLMSEKYNIELEKIEDNYDESIKKIKDNYLNELKRLENDFLDK
ncbi:FecR domain-containing protein [Candidatus Dependentiae bacterium]|nr:FecR domain-containing protein [Candidatus Dependentiae bacterium]